ncbi:hypothetical protein HK405_009252 [Cladochytrium tenue]|nr:hypothetical protein HK405_009252 [Cladochytrium tenue]
MPYDPKAINFSRALSEIVLEGSVTGTRALVVDVSEFLEDVSDLLEDALPGDFDYWRLTNWTVWKKALDWVAPFNIDTLIQTKFDAVSLGRVCYLSRSTEQLNSDFSDDEGALAALFANLGH